MSKATDKLILIASNFENKIFNKKANSAHVFYELVKTYDTGTNPLKDFAGALKMSAENFANQNDLNDQEIRRIYDIYLKEAELVYSLVPEMEALDNEIENPKSIDDF